MSTMTIEIEMNNAAFEDAPEREVARILRELADRVEVRGVGSVDEVRLRDINGNSVGGVVIS